MVLKTVLIKKYYVLLVIKETIILLNVSLNFINVKSVKLKVILKQHVKLRFMS